MSESTNTLKSIEFTWKITNYSQQKLKNGPGKWIRSQDFSVGCKGDLNFYLQFYPQGLDQSGDTEVSDEEKWTSLCLVAKGSDTSNTSRHVEFERLVNARERPYFRKSRAIKRARTAYTWSFTLSMRMDRNAPLQFTTK